MYLVYIFSIVVASMADLSSLDLRSGIFLLGYLIFIVFGSLLIQTLLSRILGVEADMMMASSVALISSPPFVPVVVSVMKNKAVLIPGLSIGIVGYAMGNYLGYLLSELLRIL